MLSNPAEGLFFKPRARYKGSFQQSYPQILGAAHKPSKNQGLSDDLKNFSKYQNDQIRDNYQYQHQINTHDLMA